MLGEKMSSNMLKWTKTTYVLVHSISITKSIRLGNTKYLEDSINDSFKWKLSSIGINSNVPIQSFRKGSVKFNDDDENVLINGMVENVADFLFINLITILDEEVKQASANKGFRVKPYLSGNIKYFTINPKYKWALDGVLEAYEIRNCLIHNSGKWSQKSIDKLKKIVNPLPVLNSKIEIGYQDLFRYKRAVRTIIGEVNK
jgi:hypothetical protein